MNVRGPQASHEPSFLWFTRGGKAYLVSDPPSLARVGEEIHAPRRREEENLGERLRELADELLASGRARPVEP